MLGSFARQMAALSQMVKSVYISDLRTGETYLLRDWELVEAGMTAAGAFVVPKPELNWLVLLDFLALSDGHQIAPLP